MVHLVVKSRFGQVTLPDNSYDTLSSRHHNHPSANHLHRAKVIIYCKTRYSTSLNPYIEWSAGNLTKFYVCVYVWNSRAVIGKLSVVKRGKRLRVNI